MFLNGSLLLQETGISNTWYEVLSVLHLMAMLSLSQANLLLLPRTSADGHQPKVSEGSFCCKTLCLSYHNLHFIYFKIFVGYHVKLRNI